MQYKQLFKSHRVPQQPIFCMRLFFEQLECKIERKHQNEHWQGQKEAPKEKQQENSNSINTTPTNTIPHSNCRSEKNLNTRIPTENLRIEKRKTEKWRRENWEMGNTYFSSIVRRIRIGNSRTCLENWNFENALDWKIKSIFLFQLE